MGEINRVKVVQAIETVAQEFLAFRWRDKNSPASPAELKARHDRIADLLEAAGGEFDTWCMVRLFNALEEIASKERAITLALTQTISPEQLKKHGVPDELIENVIKLKEHHKAEGRRGTSSKGGKGKAHRLFAKIKADMQQLARDRVPPSGQWQSRRQAVLALLDEYIAHPDWKGSKDQAHTTLDGYLAEMPEADTLFTGRHSRRAGT